MKSIQLTPETLREFVEKQFATIEYSTVPYNIGIWYHNQIKVKLPINVSGLNPDNCIQDWVEEFGTGYQFNPDVDLVDGEMVITGFTFWLEDYTDEWNNVLCARFALFELLKENQ